ncbi:conserved oligomeric Golgi complex subunit 1 isoform X1 [Stigmatopora nigra]
MTDATALSLNILEIKDPVFVFERYSTDDIRCIERKVRGEIEQKKEELRQMVGERYRDLIDAADTIGEMRQSSGSVVHSIQNMYQYCHRLKQGKAPVSGCTPESQQQDKFYTLASHIKLLLEIPERIWSAVEASQFLQATRLYLLCGHLHTLLQLEASTGGHYSPALARFPILVRQVATMGHFRSTILLDSRSLLRGRAVSDQAIAEALLSTMLLEDSSPRKALADFLLARKASIHQLLNQPQHGAGIKAQVCSLVELLVTTLFQAYAVFYMHPEGEGRAGEATLSCGLLFSILQNVTCTTSLAKDKHVLQEDASTGSWFKYLPSSVTEFQPTLRTLAEPIQRELLRDTLQQWIDTCKEDIFYGVGSLLVYVKSLKGLAAIRDAVWDLLSADSISQHWNKVCLRLLDRRLNIWDDFLQQLFLQRLQAITKEETKVISMSSVQLLTSTVKNLAEQTANNWEAQFELDVSAYMWTDFPGDLQSDAGWVSEAHKGQQQQKSALAMKTNGVTPCVQSFCSSVDAKLKARLEDLQHYLPSQDTGSDSKTIATPLSICTDGSSASTLNRFTDSPAVEEALRDSCLACVHHIIAAIHSELAKPLLDPSPASISSVLFMARLCHSMGELCPNLKQCIMGQPSGCVATEKVALRQSKKLGKANAATPVSAAQAKWAELKEELLKCSKEAYRIWTTTFSKKLMEEFATALLADSAGAILANATHWEDLEIQEEAESGSSVTSKIRLPVQPSLYVHSLLFQLCVEVNKVGGHTVPEATMQELLQMCLDQTLQHYQTLTQQVPKENAFPMTQNRALQLMFDLRYLYTTLSAQIEEGKSCKSYQDPRMQQICDWLENHIDPFDLDVFSPGLNANLNRLSQRTSVLYGLVTGSEKSFTPQSSSVNSQEPYNILPMSNTQIRFGLLPISMSDTRKSKLTTKPSRSQHQMSTTPSSADSRPGSLFRQMAEEEDTTSQSLFKLSWLSGMTK